MDNMSGQALSYSRGIKRKIVRGIGRGVGSGIGDVKQPLTLALVIALTLVAVPIQLGYGRVTRIILVEITYTQVLLLGEGRLIQQRW